MFTSDYYKGQSKSQCYFTLSTRGKITFNKTVQNPEEVKQRYIYFIEMLLSIYFKHLFY